MSVGVVVFVLCGDKQRKIGELLQKLISINSVLSLVNIALNIAIKYVIIVFKICYDDKKLHLIQ